MQKDVKNTIAADVTVIGGGPAGFGAAVAASRQGLNVCLLESGSIIGGIMATCMGLGQAAGTAAGMCVGEKTEIQNINHQELVQELRRHGINGLNGSC